MRSASVNGNMIRRKWYCNII